MTNKYNKHNLPNGKRLTPEQIQAIMIKNNNERPTKPKPKPKPKPKITKMNNITVSKFKRFHLHNGGMLSEGIEFSDGSCILHCMSFPQSISMFKNMMQIETAYSLDKNVTIKYID